MGITYEIGRRCSTITFTIVVVPDDMLRFGPRPPPQSYPLIESGSRDKLVTTSMSGLGPSLVFDRLD